MWGYGLDWAGWLADAAHLGCQYSTVLTTPSDLNRLVRFAERRNLVSARVPSHFIWPALQHMKSHVFFPDIF